MKIIQHRLLGADGRPYPYRPSANTGGPIRPEFLVFHYTAGASIEGAVTQLTRKGTGVSAHLVIGRDGRIIQLVPFDTMAWHAGRSSWQGLTGLNRYSLGIELVNAGRLLKEEGGWRTWFGTEIPPEEVLVAAHRHDPRPAGWHRYSEAQLAAALQVAEVLMDHYRLKDLLGHDDIAPGRKQDPGPAFPMAEFRRRLLKRPDPEAD